ncbi:MAG: 30S ribosomal protein S6 [Anaerolineae bacterium]
METRNYELMFVVNAELVDEALDDVLQRIQRYLENAEVEVFSFKSWGTRRLAYTLKGQRDGRYYLVRFAADPNAINELDRNLRLVEGNLRHLITRSEGVEAPEETEEAPTPAEAKTEAEEVPASAEAEPEAEEPEAEETEA